MSLPCYLVYLVGELLPFSLPADKPSILIIEIDGPQTQIDQEIEAICSLARAEGARLDKLNKYFSYVPPKGAFYVMAKYLFSDDSSQEVATRLLEEARVITIPGGSFGEGGEGHLRISFGGELQVIDEAFDRIE